LVNTRGAITVIIKKFAQTFAISLAMFLTGATSANAADFDLTISLSGVESANGGRHARPGEYLRLDTYLTNNGPDPAPGRVSVTGEVLPECPYLVGWYLSEDNVITTDDIQIGGFCPNGLEAGQTLRFWADVYIPANIQGGMYYWGAIADYNNTVVETDENNNAALGASVVIR
jgi:hypothetical protein